MEAVCKNVCEWAENVYLVDSYSKDRTIDIALSFGVHVVQRAFRNFGDQWNFALEKLPIATPWTMKLDPDERLTDELKRDIERAVLENKVDGISMIRRLHFMGRPLPVRQRILRAWKTGRCRFSDVLVNEHPLVPGFILPIKSELIHLDSPDMEHWLEKQNRYSTAEALSAIKGEALSAQPKLRGNSLERRMWMKKNFSYLPFRFFLLYAYYMFFIGCWRYGWVGHVWSQLRSRVMRYKEFKIAEMQITGKEITLRKVGTGAPDPRVHQAIS